MSKLLFEIGTEELPAGYIEPALDQLRRKFTERTAALKISHGSLKTMATPRRLCLLVEDLAEKQEDIREEILGPSAKAGLDDQGDFTRAAQGFAASKGATVEQLQKVDTAKGEYLMLVREVKGQDVAILLPSLLQQLLVDLSFPKSMRWAANSIAFARPIQWLLALHDDTVVPFEHEGIATSNVTRGHRFLHNHEIRIERPSSYEEQLATADVIVDQDKRKEMVVSTITKAVATSESLGSGRVFIDEELLDTVTNLVEFPCGICGTFDKKFLTLPDDVLITSMREHQKYFPVTDGDGRLLPGFVAVNNTRIEDETLTRQGHQRVLRARLEDALFFFRSDQEKKLEQRIPDLSGIIFQAKLGTMLEKTERIVKLTRMLAEKLDPASAEDACRAARLAKADLLTDMVGEFPTLQGIMGETYALLAHEKPAVALALREHYMPKRAGSELPSSTLGALVGLADRLDTLAGCFGIGQTPSGTTDPFGLRRIVLAILQILRERKYAFSLREGIYKALALYGDRVDGSSETVDAVLSFIEGRFRNDCIAKGHDPGAVAAASSVAFDDPNDCLKRIEALSALKTDPSFTVLASSYKRIKNIVKENSSVEVNGDLLVDPAEKNLYTLLTEVRREMVPMLDGKEYREALQCLLRMKAPVDTFFDNVMVMAEDETIRRNRLSLLTALGVLVLRIGDISMMQEQ
ncbi:MAG: glycine--tRNA ligase subunit beta [Desulfopila sp.]|jgi:glycyl-tRNA synthetase beta chain|nr:glycine--tRNA ligase subunit beta [Desulfopila sp.]